MYLMREEKSDIVEEAIKQGQFQSMCLWLL